MQNRVQNIASILFDQGVRNIIISPGSRNAPLTIAFVEHKKFNINMIYDERSAGFIALGQAIASKTPSVLICTSGTASVNYYPAICEAFYQKLPLIVLTADRPQELIDQGDGQSIRQHNIFANHILKSYQLLPDYDTNSSYQHLQRVVNDAYFKSANRYKRGPVHINIPFREPFYPIQEHKPTSYKVIEKHESDIKRLDKKTKDSIQKELNNYKKILVFKGQELEDTLLTKFNKKIAIAKDVMGKSCNTDGFITMHDFLFKASDNLPDLILTIGHNFLSKSMKTAFRNSSIEHWHIGTQEIAQDVFQKMTKHISCSPKYFFNNLEINAAEYRNNLFNQELSLRKTSNTILKTNEFTEFTALYQLTQLLPKRCNLHISNSMPIRYMNHLQYTLKHHNVYCNRGTSGIDGSISTAVGIASLLNEDHYIISGDLSFFYDKNGLWNGIDKENVNIILLNNHGGGIFDIIKGPNNQKIEQSYFTTPQPLKAKNTAKDFGMDYYRVKNIKDLKSIMKEFTKQSCPNGKILEIETDMNENTNFYKNFINDLSTK